MHTHVALQREGGQMMFLRATSIPVRAKNVDGRWRCPRHVTTAAAAQNVRSHYFFAASLACLGRTTTPPNVTSFTHAAVTHLDRAERRPKSAISGGMLCNQLPCVLTVLLEYACMPEMHAKK